MMDIFDIQGNVILSVPVTSECEHAEELMRTDEVRMFWNSDVNTTLPVGAYVEVGGERYSLVEPYKPTQRRENEWRYEPVFVSAFFALSKVPFYMYTYEGGVIGVNNIISREADWVLTDNAYNFLDTIRQAIENETGLKYAIAVAQDLPASKTVTFSSVDIFSALTAIAGAFETEFWLEKFASPNASQQIGRIHLSFANDGATAKNLTVGTNINVPSVTEGSEGFFNRFVVLGSTRNITQEYQGAGVNSVANKRLTLDPHTYPDGYIDYAGGGRPFTKILVFDDIYPASSLRIKAGGVLARTRYVLDDDDRPVELRDGVYDQYAIYYVKLEKYENGSWSDFVFNNTDYDAEDNPSGMRLPNLKVSIHFSSGPLSGREFELNYLDDPLTNVKDKADTGPFSCPAGYFEIIKTQEGDYIIPALTGLVPGANDEVVLFNIKMPDDYVTAAQTRLKEAAIKEIGKRYLQLYEDGTAKTDSSGNLLRVDLNSYQFTSNPVAFGTSNPDLKIGSNVTYYNSGNSLSTRVKALVTKLDYPIKQTITIGEELTRGTIQELKDEAANANQSIDLLGALSSSTQRLLDAYNRTQELIQARLVDNFFQINRDLGTLVELRSAYSYLGLKDGIFFAGATLTGTPTPDLYVDTVPDGQGGNVRVLRTPLAFITGGDQIVVSGTPGGGGGGAGLLTDLNDIYPSAKPSARKILVFDPNQYDKIGNPGAWVYADMPTGSITSVTKGTAVSGGAVTTSGGVVTIQFPTVPTVSFGTAGSDYIPITLGGTTKNVLTAHQSLSAYLTSAAAANTYLPLSAGSSKPLTGTLYIDTSAITSLIITNTATSATVNAIRFNLGNSAQGYFGMQDGQLFRANSDWSSQYIVYDSGNLSIATLAGSSAVGSVAQPVYYTGSAFATVQATFGSQNYGEHDANNIASNGLWYYNSNGPATSLGASTYDGALYSQAYSTNWVGQIAQDYRNGRLFVRGKNNGTWQSWLKVWDSGNLTPSDYVLKAGDTMTGGLIFANNFGVSGTDSEGSARTILYLNSNNHLVIGNGMRDVQSGGNTYLRGIELHLQTSARAGSYGDCVIVNSSGNVTIGASDLAENSYKLYVNGASRVAGQLYVGTSSVGNINFLRGSANYITAPADGYFTFIPNGLTTNNGNSPLIVTAGSVYPGTDTDLGRSSSYWHYAYVNRLCLATGVYLEYNSQNGYIYISKPIVTEGDQIVASGTPGGGGGTGGAGFVYELKDTLAGWTSNTGVSTGQVLMYQAGANSKNGTGTGAWKFGTLAISNISGLQSALDGKQASGNYVTSVKVGSTSYTPSSGVVSLPAYPTSLPASDVYAWAKAATKPTYTLDEVADGSTRKLSDCLTGTSNKNITVRATDSSNTWGALGFADGDNTKYNFKVVRFGEFPGASYGGTLSAYGSGLFFGGADTRAFIAVRYASGHVEFGGGSASASTSTPTWHFGINGTDGATYDLPTISANASSGATAYGILGSSAVGSVAQPVYYTGSAFAAVQARFGNKDYGEHNANVITLNGLWYYSSNGPDTSLGASTNDGALYSQAYSEDWVGQIAQDYRTGHLFVRGKNNGTWQSWLRVWDSGNASIANSAITLGSTSLGTSSAPIGYASNATAATYANRLTRRNGTNSAGGYDLSTMLAGGGITSQYSSDGYWANGPTGMNYGSAMEFHAYHGSSATGNSLNIQFAWDINHNTSTPTRYLWYRSANNLGWANDWHLVYDSGNANLSTVPWACKTLSAGSNNSGWTGTFTSTNSAVYLANASGSAIYAATKLSDTSGYLLDLRYGQTTLGSGGSYALYVRSDGNVGVGTNAPGARLEIANATSIPVLISAATSMWAYIRFTNVNTSTNSWDIGTVNSTGTDIAQANAFEIRDVADSRSGISIRHATSSYGKLVVRVPSGQCSIGYWSAADNPVSGSPVWTVGFTADSDKTFGWYYRASSGSGWKMLLDGAGNLTHDGVFNTSTVNLRRSTGTSYGRISFYSPTYKTWFLYMSNRVAGGAPNGSTPAAGSVVTNWALRSVIENSTGYGWIWESNANTATTAPTIMMELSATSGTLATKGDQVVSSDATLKKNWRDLKYGIGDIAKATAGVFDWKDGRGSSAGTKAQDWMHLVPQLVHGEEGHMTLAYGQIAMLNTILLARGYESHEAKIARLEGEVEALKAEVERLRMN